MTNSIPAISLGLPVYNGAEYLAAMIESIQAQTFTDFELIITDNASTDDTADIARAYAKKDPRIHYHLNERNVGAAGNYNRCFELGRGKYFKWCAHDDLLSPNFLEACYKALEERDDIVMAFGAKVDIDGSDNEIPSDNPDQPVDFSDNPSERYYFQIAKLIAPNSPIFGLFRRDVLEKTALHLPYYSSDRGLLAEVAIMGNFLLVPEAVHYCRQHDTRSVNIGDQVERSIWISGTSSRKISAEHINLTKHLYDMTGQHRDVVSPGKLRWQLLKFAVKPRQIAKYGIDIIGLILPQASVWLKSTARSFRRRSRA